MRTIRKGKILKERERELGVWVCGQKEVAQRVLRVIQENIGISPEMQISSIQTQIVIDENWSLKKLIASD